MRERRKDIKLLYCFRIMIVGRDYDGIRKEIRNAYNMYIYTHARADDINPEIRVLEIFDERRIRQYGRSTYK